MADKKSGQARLPLLDGLRGLAAIIILFYHMQNVFGGIWFASGYLVVDLFFLISGFVLTIVAEPRMVRGLSAPLFINLRVRRLWPMIALGTCLGATVDLYIGDRSQSATITMLFLGLLLIPTGEPVGPLFPLNGPQWSILTELLANLAHVVFIARLGKGALAIFIVISDAALVAAIYMYGDNTFGSGNNNWFLGLLRVAFSYGVGVFIARNWSVSADRQAIDWQILFATIFGIVVIAPFLNFPSALVDAIIVTVAFPTLFWLLVRCKPPHPRTQIWMQRVGAISFPLYAIHMPLLRLFGWLENSQASALSAMCLSLVVASALAWAGASIRSSRLNPELEAQRSPVRHPSVT